MKLFLILACASLSFGLASPLAAQEAPPPAPQAEQLPPPPPFPPMPSAKPSHRWVDMGGHTSRARSKASPTRRHASSAKKARSSRKAGKGHKASASRRAVRKEKAVHFSAKTIRSCHAMTYRQIIRNSSCRTMIKQDLAAAPAPKHRASRKASAHHKAASRSKRRRR